MIIYSIVLIVFVVVFALIASERATTLATQQATLMQLLAQNVAGYISQAVQAGNGYSVTAPLGTGIGQVGYNISVSTSGVVLARTRVGNEIITGEALSGARRIFINGTLVASSNSIQLYQIPTYSGSIYISNAGGSIFVDEAAPSPSTLIGAASLSQPEGLNAPYFGGIDSLISANNAPNLVIGNSITLEAWVYLQVINTQTASPYLENPVIGEAGSASLPFMLTISDTGIPTFLLNWGGNFKLQPTYGIVTKTWYDIAATYNKTSGVATLYINGNSVATSSTSIAISGSGNVIIGASPQNGTYLTGYIADAQVYNASLSANQVALLYSSGPAAAPSRSLSRLVGWWPLNGNANDYSGYGNHGTSYNIIYKYVVDTLAQVLTQGGTPVSGTLIGIASTNNLLGGGNSLAGYTNQAGLQRTLLTASGFIGNTTVQAAAFNGNLSTVKNVIGWWPLDLGNSNSVGEYSGRSIGGNFVNGAYGYLANRTNFLAGQFNGVNSMITTGSALNPSSFTLTFWVNGSSQSKMTSANGYTVFNSMGSGNAVGFWLNNGGAANAVGGAGDEQLGLGGNLYHGYGINGTLWSFVAVSVDNGAIDFYANNMSAYATNGVGGPYTINQLAIGQSGQGISALQGGLSNVQLYTSALTPDQISGIYSQGIAGLPITNANLTAWYPLNGNANNNANVRNIFSSAATQLSYNSVSFANPTVEQGSPLFPIFNGISKVTFASAPLPSSNLCSLTVAAWAYDRGMPGSSLGGIFNFSNTGHDEVAMNDNSINFEVASSGTPDSWTITPGYSMRGSWNFLLTRLSNGIVTGFLNGVPAGTPQNSNVGCINVANGVFGYSGSAYMNGSIVDVQVYNTSLTNLQIEQLYLQGVPAVAQLNTTLG
jgi:hypothetical protein